MNNICFCYNWVYLLSWRYLSDVTLNSMYSRDTYSREYNSLLVRGKNGIEKCLWECVRTLLMGMCENFVSWVYKRGNYRQSRILEQWHSAIRLNKWLDNQVNFYKSVRHFSVIIMIDLGNTFLPFEIFNSFNLWRVD